ncbi:MAG: PorT family protein [Chitinispirillia bacterium]|nr:PorT family protein [Chitinispirillia bacterium]MCL2268473.1 PorT family protein [Chitinispirillia bacterium]
MIKFFAGKKFLIAAAAAGIVAFGGIGAKAEAQVSSIGLRLGYNTNTMTMPYSTFDNTLTWTRKGRFTNGGGVHAGISLNIPISEMDIAGDNYLFGICPNFLFTTKGGEVSITYNSLFRGTYRVDAYYLDVPIPFTFKRDFGSYAVRVEIGPYVALGLFGDQKIEVSGLNLPYKESSFSKEGLSRLDVGLFYGVALEFMDTYFVSLRAGSGLTDEEVTAVYLTLGYNINF